MALEPQAQSLWDAKFPGRDAVPWDEFSKGLTEYFTAAGFYCPNFCHRICRYVVTTGSDGNVTKVMFRQFLSRFGPLPRCLEKAGTALFNTSGLLQPFFHGAIDRNTSAELLATNPAGSYLVRTSSKFERCLVLSLSHMEGSKIVQKNCLIHNLGARGYGVVPDPKPTDPVYESIADLLAASSAKLITAITSDLSLRCQADAEAEAKLDAAPAPPADDPYGSFDPTAAGTAAPGGAADDPYGSFDPSAAPPPSGADDPYGSFDPGASGGGGGAADDPYGSFDPSAGGGGGGDSPYGSFAGADGAPGAGSAYGSFTGDETPPEAKDGSAADAYGAFVEQ